MSMDNLNNYYELTFSGQIAEGFDPETVRTNATKLFHLSPQKSERLLSGATIILKKKLSEAVANTYQLKLTAAGLLCDVRPMATGQPSPDQTAVPAGLPVHEPDFGTVLEIDESFIDDSPETNAVATASDADQMAESAQLFETINLDVDALDTDGFEVDEGADFLPETESQPEADAPTDNEYLLDDEFLLDSETSLEIEEALDVELLEAEPAEIEPQPESVDELDWSLAPVGSELSRDDDQPPPPDTNHIPPEN